VIHSGSSIKNAAPIWPSAKSPAIAAAMEIYLTQPPLRIILVMGTISIITAVTVLRLIKHEVEFISMEHTLLFTEGTWMAKGYYSDETNNMVL